MLRPLEGLVAAAFTPLDAEGGLALDRVPALVEHAVATGMVGLYVCGSTGEGASLTAEERRAAAEAFVRACAGRLPVIVQVGHDSLEQARALAQHAAEVGADAISAVPPVYFKPQGLAELVDGLARLAAAAPGLPFLYYHIPALTGFDAPGLEVLEAAREGVPTFAGIKYTAPTLDDYQACVEAAGDGVQVLYGRDEMMLAALAVGARGFVGSTYNLIAPVYHELAAAWRRGDVDAARAAMSRAQALVRLIPRHGRGAQKAMMGWLHLDVGPSRAPIATPRGALREALVRDLEALGVRAWLDEAAGA